MKNQTAAIHNRLAEIRTKRGIAAATLAKGAGISRQTIYAIEAGTYIPNTAVALRLAQALEVAVEDLFRLQAHAEPAGPIASIELLGSDDVAPGVPVQLCRVGRHTVGVPALATPWQLPAADAVFAGSTRVKTTVRMLCDEVPENRLLIAGCDPAMSILVRHAQRAEVDVILASTNSSQAVLMLKSGLVHIAGLHFGGDGVKEDNIAAVRSAFPSGGVALITFGIWEQGIVVASGNPKRIGSVSDLVGRGVTIVNRERGAGSRSLLDAELKKAHIDASRVRGYESLAAGHLTAAWQVYAGLVDCCIAPRAAASAFGLDFVSLTTERFDFAIRVEQLRSLTVERLLDVMSLALFRRELHLLGGHATGDTGQRLM